MQHFIFCFRTFVFDNIVIKDHNSQLFIIEDFTSWKRKEEGIQNILSGFERFFRNTNKKCIVWKEFF